MSQLSTGATMWYIMHLIPPLIQADAYQHVVVIFEFVVGRQASAVSGWGTDFLQVSCN